MSIVSGRQLLLSSAAAAAATGISRSLRFNSSDSAYLSRTPSSAGNRKTWTLSCWVKRCALGTRQSIFDTTGGNNANYTEFTASNTFQVGDYGLSSWNWQLVTSQVFRDTSAWFHLVIGFDSTQATPADRVRLYVNASQVTALATATYPSLNADGFINSTVAHEIGRGASPDYFSGYLAEIHFIDGQALTPSSFGQTDANGEWQPIAYTGTYGTNGFKLNFADNSAATAAALGKDISGNGNNWTPTNLSVTAGAGNDSLVDTPTSYGTDTSVGGEVRGNYCIWNALAVGSASDLAPSNGNLDATGFSVAGYRNKSITATIGITSGKWYWEVALTSVTSTPAVIIGIANKSSPYELGYFPGDNASGWGYYAANGNKYNAGASSAYGASYTAGDVIGVALDADSGSLTLYKNGVSQGVAYSGLPAGTYYPAIGHAGSTQAFVTSTNFGQRPFAYTAPSGFKALVDTNLPAPLVAKPSTVMDVKLYTGNGSTQTISGLGFSPDLVWIKIRSGVGNHRLIDSVRGRALSLSSDATNADSGPSNSDRDLTAFTSDGFSLGINQFCDANASSSTYVAWAWDAGSSTVTNTQGSITSSVRANASAGFSIVSYTSTGGTATVGHGLGIAPSMVITKGRNVISAFITQHVSLAANNVLYLNGTDASQDVSGNGSLPKPTSTVFSVNNQTGSNGGTYNMIAYCFAPVTGYSSFGSYTADGSTDGPFVFCNFRPRLVIVKAATRTFGSAWSLIDTARNTGNFSLSGSGTNILYASSSNQEFSSGGAQIDILSNGFKARNNSSDVNDSGTYIYAAFAESPFAYSRAR